MSGFPILDLMLGLVFIYFILSIITSALVESVLTKRNYRSKVLTQWLFAIFDKEITQPDGKIVKLGQAIADHCLTTGLSKEKEATTFMDANQFVSALLEKLTFDLNNPSNTGFVDLDDLLKRIGEARALDGTGMLSTELMRTFQLFGNEAKLLAPRSLVGNNSDVDATQLPNNIPPNSQKNSLQIFREKLESWFDASMDRLTGSMKKRYVRPLTFWFAIVVVVFANADTIKIASYLYQHKEEAAIFAAKAQTVSNAIDSTVTTDPGLAMAVLDTLNKNIPAGMPFGWPEGEKISIEKVKGHVVGWLATVLAIMLGAPFWFDLLNKISNVRGTGERPPSISDAERSVAKRR